MILIFFIVLLTNCSTIPQAKCQCPQLLSQSDCEQNKCLWENNKCSVNTNPPIIIENNKFTFCKQFSIDNCSKTLGCACIDEQCTHFTGCSAYYYIESNQCSEISNRCISDGVHCVEISNCSDYKTQISCNLNKNGKYCEWKETQCYDITDCSKLPNILKSDEECRNQLPYCTVGEQNGCIDSADTCVNQKLQTQCKWDKAMKQSCIWVDNKCVSQLCSNAPITYVTNQQCNNFMKTCITQLNGGCITITTCDNIKIQEACEKDQNGLPCIWIENKCIDQDCSKAPSSFNTNEQCKKIKDTCVTTLNGCVEFNNCSNVNTQQICNDNKCYWNGSKCVEKICKNNTTSTTENDCNTYLDTCTLNPQTSIGCVNKVCDNIITQNECSIDKFNNKCTWYNSCFKKTCQNAPKSIINNNECEVWLINCVLDDSGSGCNDMMITCSGYQSQNSCYRTRQQKYCQWIDNKCQDRLCNMANQQITTTSECQQFKPDCLLNNTQKGCMDKTNNCTDRKLYENCAYGNNPVCVWKSSVSQCLQLSCQTANIVESPNYLVTFTQQNCESINCILNSTADGCMDIPDECTSLTLRNCFKSKKNDCLFVGGQCKDKICSNLIGTSHSDCLSQMNTCTINSNNSGCTPLLQICSQYTLQTQCVQTISGKACIWNGINCADAICANSLDTVNYDTYDKCNKFNSQCTVISKVGHVGCTDIETNCESYKYDYQCYVSQSKNCIWKNNQCYSISTCGDIVLNTYTDIDCQIKLISCKSNITNTGCISKVCSDYSNSPFNYRTQEECEKITGCTTNKDANLCITKQLTCDQYLDLTQCKYATEGECIVNAITNKCQYIYMDCSIIATPADDSSCTNYRAFCTKVDSKCSNRTCTSKTGSWTKQDCLNYDKSCINTNDNLSCITMLSLCQSYQSSNTCNCSINEQNCVWDTATSLCKVIGTAMTKNCQLVVKAGATESECQKQSKYCTANRTETACVTIESDCARYATLQNCYKSSKGRCIQSQRTDSGATCIEITSTTQCSSIYFGEAFIYTHDICEQAKQTCTNNSTTGCQNKICDQAPVNYVSHADCQNWLSECTYDTNTAKCISMKLTCQELSISNCLYSKEGRCIVYDGKCLNFTCQLLPNSLTNHSQCQNEAHSCTVANQGGCINKKASCSDYKSEIQCYQTSLGQNCLWQTFNMKCIDLLCSSIQQSNPYNNHNACYNVYPQLKCTVANSGLGCQDLNVCSSYLTSASCQVNKSGQLCVWDTNSTPVCVDKTCDAASSSNTSHNQCQGFDPTCTVKVTVDDSQNQVVAGCTTLKGNCSDYSYESQCNITNSNTVCGWDGTKCIDYSCEVAPKTSNYATHENCQTFLNTCTVSSDQLGCITIPKNCSDITQEFQCFIDSNQKKCTWLNSKCQDRTCDNAPNTITTAQQCWDDWLNGCTAETTNKCKTQNCQDFYYTTDQECRSAMTGCTTDGNKCTMRGSCEQALSQASCTQSISGETCYWKGSECSIKICENINQKADCTQEKCIWDENKCRKIGECQDYKGTSFTECQKQNSQCTVSEDKITCKKLQNCLLFVNQEACIYGLDGPCLWLDSINKCYPYIQCQSIQFKTHQECQQVSPLCTTDGQICIPITSCAETNIKGCISGIDGDCLLTVPSLGATSAPVCKLFTKCEDAFYLTHSECQNANKNCTTNGLTSCIQLSDCQTYQRQDSCVKDFNGQQLQNNQIISTGLCVWENNICRNQQCKDFSGITHEECVGYISNCTFDGQKCIEQSVCNNYATQIICSSAYGLEGKCFWNKSVDVCQSLTCDQITDGSTIQQCKKNLATCITDGTNCVNKDVCARYLTKTACNQEGTDGICVWSNDKCSLMTSCTQADKDQDACFKAADRCSFKFQTNESNSSCSVHTCETYQKSNGLCKSFSNWNYQTKTACSLIENKCQEFDLTTLNESECLKVSEYTYTWNSGNNKCQSCSNQQQNSTQTSTNSSSTNTTTPTNTVDDSKQILLSLIMIMMM